MGNKRTLPKIDENLPGSNGVADRGISTRWSKMHIYLMFCRKTKKKNTYCKHCMLAMCVMQSEFQKHNPKHSGGGGGGGVGSRFREGGACNSP